MYRFLLSHVLTTVQRTYQTLMFLIYKDICISVFQSNLSRVSVKGSTNSLSAIETADELSDVESVAFEEADTASSQHPLFLHLMCSIRDRSLTGSEIGLIHVNTLPTCLGT